MTTTIRNYYGTNLVVDTVTW